MNDANETQATYHALFNREGSAVESCEIEANSLADCEAKLIELHPDATYWEIGVPV